MNLLRYNSHSWVVIMGISVAFIFNLELYTYTLLSGFFIGRELAQAEYRGIYTYYQNKRTNAPWYVGFQPRNWTKKSLLNDMIYPIILGGLLCVIGNLF